ncbi:MAG: N-acetyl-gamma-glutamyl-phosphate reductase [Polyangiaceae bacterium]
MKAIRVGVVGASGYSGAVVARLLASHPAMHLVFATSDKLSGEPVATHLGLSAPLPGDPDLRYVPNGSALEQADRCDAVFLATAADVSMRLAPEFAGKGKQVVDLSGAFRLDAGAYPKWYGFDHGAPAWLDRAHYGLPELYGAPPSRGSPGSPAGAIVANPGCYPTPALLALAPLLREKLVEPAGLVIDAKSGVTGAGKQTGEAFSFAEYGDDVHAYKLLAHQHTPEITRGLARFADGVKLTFTAHYLPVKRGLVATCYARPRPGATAARVAECLADAYAKTPFVRAVAPDRVGLKRVVGTNACHVGATADGDVVIAIGAIDNLLKGAAGQALQNLNLMNGRDESEGLTALQPASP